jgi:hypothetical protein
MARPKFGEAGHVGESGADYGARIRKWNADQAGGRQVKPGLKPADETVPSAGAEPTQRPGESVGAFKQRKDRWTAKREGTRRSLVAKRRK